MHRKIRSTHCLAKFFKETSNKQPCLLNVYPTITKTTKTSWSGIFIRSSHSRLTLNLEPIPQTNSISRLIIYLFVGPTSPIFLAHTISNAAGTIWVVSLLMLCSCRFAVVASIAKIMNEWNERNVAECCGAGGGDCGARLLFLGEVLRDSVIMVCPHFHSSIWRCFRLTSIVDAGHIGEHKNHSDKRTKKNELECEADFFFNSFWFHFILWLSIFLVYSSLIVLCVEIMLLTMLFSFVIFRVLIWKIGTRIRLHVVCWPRTAIWRHVLH